MNTSVYRHFTKGTLYKVLGTALNTETGTTMVIFKKYPGSGMLPHMFVEGEVFALDIGLFTEEIPYRGELVKRFQLVKGKNKC